VRPSRSQMVSEAIRILNHEKHETHETDGGTRKRLPVVVSTSKYAAKILSDCYRGSIHRPSCARAISIEYVLTTNSTNLTNGRAASRLSRDQLVVIVGPDNYPITRSSIFIR